MVIIFIIILAICVLAKWFWMEHKEDEWVKSPIQLVVFGGVALWCYVSFGLIITLGGVVILYLCGIWREL